jgi:hypothetical protein
MRPNSISPRLALLLAPLSLAATSCLPSVDLTPRYGVSSLDGDFKSGGGSSSFDSMGLGDDEGVAGLRADLKWGMPHLIVSGSSTEYSGSGTLDGSVGTIAGGTAVNSTLDFGLLSGLLLFDFGPTDMLELGIGFGATQANFDLDVQDAGSANQFTTSGNIFIPVIAGSAGIQLGPFEIAAVLSGMTILESDFDGTYMDLDLFGRYKFFGGKSHFRMSAIAGWRQVDLDTDYDSNDLELSFSGPYLGVEVTL